MIANGKVVSISYRLTNESGQELERTDRTEPFCYVHGKNTIVSGLESGLSGLKPGDVAKITVPAKDAYGEIDGTLKTTMDLSLFPDGDIDVGELFRVTQPDGSAQVYVVESVENGKVTVNANHPLAGQILRFEVEVLEVRDATPQETASGEVTS